MIYLTCCHVPRAPLDPREKCANRGWETGGRYHANAFGGPRLGTGETVRRCHKSVKPGTGSSTGLFAGAYGPDRPIPQAVASGQPHCSAIATAIPGSVRLRAFHRSGDGLAW